MDLYDLIKKCENEIPDSLSEFEKTRFAYIWLGKRLRLDENYFFGDPNEKKKFLKNAQNAYNLGNLNNVISGNKVICVTATYLYTYMLQQLGINAFLSYPTARDPHIYTKIILSDGRIMKADLQKDIHNIQFGLKTKNFGTDYEEAKVTDISKNEIENADRKINYLNDKAYKNQIFNDIKLRCLENENDFSKETFKRVLNDIANSFELKDKKIIEIQNLYKVALREIFEIKNICKVSSQYIYEMTNMNRIEFQSYYFRKDNYKRYGQFILYNDKEKGDTLFVYDEKENKFKEISKENLKRQVKNGLIPNNKNHEILGVKAKQNKIFNKEISSGCLDID